MYRATLGDALASRIPVVLNIKPSDIRVIQYINSACQRLITRGHWIGTVQTYTVRTDSKNVSGQTLTLPPQFATIEGIAVCRSPLNIRPWWYMWNNNGWGITRSSDTTQCASQAIMLGNFCTFAELPATGLRIRFQCDLVQDVGKTAIVFGYDGNGNWIRTVQGGVMADGEVIALSQTPGTLSVNSFSQVTDIQFPVVNTTGIQTPSRVSQAWLYSFDGTTNTMIGQYQWWETRPSYRRYVIPVFQGAPVTNPSIDLVGKMNFIPVSNPNDYLSIPNLEAVRLGCMAVKAEEEHLWDEAAIMWEGKRDQNGKIIREGAITILENELQHFNGDAEQPSLVVGNSYIEPIEQLL